ncbi:MAG: adenylyltransferase/cytidyltransferase family protein [Nanoarchaeota archaeon]
MSQKVVGYTAGVFDLFHIGHINLLRNAKAICDYLIVAVSTDEHVKNYKNKTPIIPYDHRIEVVKACKYADIVVPQDNGDRIEAWRKMKFDVMIVGDDWYGTEKWQEYEKQLKDVGVKIVFFPYTKNISSTRINDILEEKRKELEKKERELEELKRRIEFEKNLKVII